MGVPSWMVRRFPRGGRGVDDEVKLDPKKGFVDNLREVLSNAIYPEIGISRDDFFHCLRPLLIHESVRIRATALNLVKHFLRSKQDFASCVKLQYPFLIARSLDLKVQSDTERVQAICVARRMLCVNATEFPLAVARALVAVATSTIDEKDRLLRASLAALVELCILNPETFITAGGVTALIRNLGSITMARMAESMLGALLFLLNDPVTRSRAHIDLSCLAVPYTEGGPQGGPQGGTRLEWAHVVLVSLLRSWPGMLHFCHTQREGLRSIVATLYLNQHEVRRSVVDLLYEVLNVCQPEWSDEAQVALDAVDPSRHQDAYRLADGFVAQEGRTVLPHCSRTRVNLQEVHLSLLLYSFLEAGILDAIVEVIVSDDSFLSVRATILLGELLHLTHLLLPPECCHVTPVMPTLVSYAVRGRRSATSLTQTNFGANRHQASSNSSAHYERFRRQMQQDEQRRMRRRREAVGGGGGGGEGKRERRRTVSGQSCRSRTVSDSSGDRSRLDRDSVSASNEPYNACQSKTTSKATSLLRDIQNVLKDNSELNSSATSLDDNNQGQQQLQYTDKVVPEIVGDGTKVIPEIVEGRDVDKVTLENLNRQLRDCIKVGTDRVTLENLDRQFHGDKAGQNRFFGARNWEPGQQPLPEFFEKGAPAFEEDLTARYPVDEPFSIRVQQRALTAVATLARLHRMLRKRPAPSSIFLDHLITSIDKKQSPTSSELARAKGKTLSKSKLSQLLNKESEEAIKDSGVLIVKDPFSWNWDVIRSILKGKPDFSNETTHRQFLRKLLQFFLPSSRQLMRIDVGDRRIANIYTMTALDFLDCLVVSSVKDSECEKMLLELFGNISTEICQVKSAPHSCLLSPQNVSGTLCSDYFLYVGHLSRSETGRSVLDKTGVFNLLLELITCINLDCYVKLIVSTLDYTEPGFARKIMDTVLKSDVVGFRMYATKMLHVMLRTPMQACQSMIDWVIVGLIEKVSDTDRAISNVALEALDEACDCVEYLRSVVKMYPIHFETLSDSGLLVGVRLLSTPEGFVRGLGDGFVRRQLEYWGEEMNLRYVCVVEGRLCDSLTLHERNEDGTYCGRVSGVKRSPGDVFVPAHLYGQLVQHEAGFKMLIEDEHVKRMVEIVHQSITSTERAVLELKAALWALGAVASWPVGVRWVCAQGITQAVLRLVTASCGGVYSVRATALYALSMMATSEDGACALREEGGWHTTRHNRHERWPVLVKLDLLEDVVVNDDEEQDTSQDSSSLDQSADPNTGTLGRGHFYLPLDSDDQLMAGSADGQLTAADGQLMRQRRAATLPARGTSDRLMTPGYQHIRSYSESKADEECPSADSRANLSIEGLRKNRPSSCDVSSGSSTDSVQQYGKYNVADRIQTLSPIPSSGSLTTIKYPAVTNPRSRRTSVTNSVSSHKSARLSQQDAQGYATLRFLHRGRRPLLNTTNQLTTSFNQLTTTFNQLTPLSPIEQLASADLRRQISPLVRPRNMMHQVEASEFEGGVGAEAVLCDVTAGKNVQNMMPYQSSRSCIARGSDASGAEESSWSGPTYLGICLPHNLCDLFPSDDLRHDKPKPYNRTDVDTNEDAGADNSSADSETDTGTDSGGGGGVALLAVTAANSSRQRRRHDRQNCLLCTSNRAANQRVSRLRKISSSSTHRTRTETESSYGAPNEGESPIMLPWQTRGGLEGVNSVDSSSSATSIVHRSPMDNMRSRSMVRRDILKMTSQLANPVLYKTCKQALLQLKQLYNDLFQDICVYSDVCSIIANSQHRIQARRFLQELFLDIPFTELYEDAITLLSTNGDNGGLEEYQDNQLTSAGGGGGDQLMQNQLASAQSADGGGGGGDSCDANPSNSSGGYRAAVGGMKGGAKSAFNDEQRSNPLLEVIPEHDARSDGSSRADSLSQSMLNLSDFSAPNSFDANDGVACLLSTSLDTTAYNQPTTTSPPLVERPRLHSTSSTSSSPMVLLSHSNSLPSYKSGSRSTFKTGLKLSSQSPSAEKAKQMIEMSSSNISVLQEALKKTGGSSSSLSATANQRPGSGVGVAEVTNEKRGAGKVGSEVTNERRGAEDGLEVTNETKGAEDSVEKATNQERGFERSGLEVTNQTKGTEDSVEKATNQERGFERSGLEVTNERRGAEDSVEKVTNQERGFERSGFEVTNEKRRSENVGLEVTNERRGTDDGVDKATNQERGFERSGLEVTNEKRGSGNVGLEETNERRGAEDSGEKATNQERGFERSGLEATNEKRGLKGVSLDATNENEASKIVGFESTNKMEGLKSKGSVAKIDKDGSKVVDMEKVTKVVDIEESGKKKVLENVDVLQVDQNKVSKDGDLEVSNTKKGLDFVDLEATEMKKLEVLSVKPEKVSKIVESKRGLDTVNLLEDTKEAKSVGLKSVVRKEESKNKDLKLAEQKVGSKVEEEIEPSSNLTKDDPSLKLTKVDPSLKLTKVDPSLKLTKVDPSLKLTKVDPSLNLTKVDPSLNLTKVDPSLNLTKVDPSLKLTEVDPSLKHTEVNPSLNLTKVDPSLSSLSKQVDSNLSSLKSDEFQKLDLSLSNPESYQSKQSQKVDLGLCKLGLEVDSVESVVSYEETITKTQFKCSENLVSTGESFVVESQIKSRSKTDIGSAVNFENVVSDSNLALGSDQESSKTVKEISSTEIIDNLQRLSSIELESLKSSCSSPSKNVGETSKQQKSLTKNVSKTSESLKDFGSGSGVLKIEGSSPKQELKSESVDLSLGSSDLKLKSGNLKTEVSTLKIDNSSLESGSSPKMVVSSSNRDSSPLKVGNSSLKLEDSSSKRDSSPLKVGNSSSKSESSSKLEDSSSKRDSSPMKVENSSLKSGSSSKSEDSSSKRDSSPLKAGNSSSKTKKSSKSDGSSLRTDSKSGTGSLKLNCGSSKVECSSESDSKPISKSDITPLKLECIDNSSSKVEKSSSKLERPESNTSKSVISSLKSESITSSKSDTSSSKFEISNSKLESPSSKPPKDSKANIRGKRLKSQQNTGPSLLSNSTSPSSSSPANSSSSKTKITSKRNEDVTGSGSVHTKPGLATDNTKPAGSGMDNTKPGLATDNTKPAGSGTDKTKPGLATDNTKPAGSGTDNTKPGLVSDNKKPGLVGDNTKPSSVSDSTKPTTVVKNQRQRKKATAKEPIRESLEVGKK